MKLSKRKLEVEARRAADPIARAVGRTDIDYENPDELPTAPRGISPTAIQVGEAENLDRDVPVSKEFYAQLAECLHTNERWADNRPEPNLILYIKDHVEGYYRKLIFIPKEQIDEPTRPEN